jgi:hypothetical protein
MVSFDQVRQFVNNDVLKAQRVLLGEFEVDPDAGCLAVAGAPRAA